MFYVRCFLFHARLEVVIPLLLHSHAENENSRISKQMLMIVQQHTSSFVELRLQAQANK